MEHRPGCCSSDRLGEELCLGRSWSPESGSSRKGIGSHVARERQLSRCRPYCRCSIAPPQLRRGGSSTCLLSGADRGVFCCTPSLGRSIVGTWESCHVRDAHRPTRRPLWRGGLSPEVERATSQTFLWNVSGSHVVVHQCARWAGSWRRSLRHSVWAV